MRNMKSIAAASGSGPFAEPTREGSANSLTKPVGTFPKEQMAIRAVFDADKAAS
jgi:hypothetical protein